jgi:hypothetical protein
MPYTFDQPHAFHAASRRKPDVCSTCLRSITHPNHQAAIPCMESAADRAQARAEAEGAELSAEIRRPLRDVSKAAGIMEREAPLFFGTGENPSLF